MPRYDFTCPDCGETREVIRRMSDDSDEVCDCGATMIRVYKGQAPHGHVEGGTPTFHG